MRKSYKLPLIISFTFCFLGIILLFLYNFNKDSYTALVLTSKDETIKNLESTIKQLEDKNGFLLNELEAIQLRLKNELDSTKLQKEKQIEDTFSWINNYNWNRVTLTNSSGTTIDITESDIVKYHFINNNLIGTFKFEYIKTSPISKAYTYTFYFDDFSKDIILSNRGFVHDIWVCQNTFLYNAAEALIPVQDELSNVAYTAKQLLLESKFFTSKRMYGENDISASYPQIRYIVLEWMPENTAKIDKLPNNVNKEIINIECLYNGTKAYFKTYTYDNIEDYYTEDYYIELSNDFNTEIYKLVDKPDISLWQIFSSSIE